MAYAIITGAHFFPYAWFYDELGYAVSAGVIAIGVLWVALAVGISNMYLVPLFTAGCLLLLVIWLVIGQRRKRLELI